MSTVMDKRMRSAAAHTKGRQDYRQGVVAGDNPFGADTFEFWDWMAGWTAAGMEKHNGGSAPRHDAAV
jgi:hypothetical protein